MTLLSELIEKKYPVKGTPVRTPTGEVRRADWCEHVEDAVFIWTFPIHPKNQQESEDAQKFAAHELELTGDPEIEARALEDFRAGRYLTTAQFLSEIKGRQEPFQDQIETIVTKAKARAETPDPPWTEAEILRNITDSDLLHKLWTKAVGTPGYEKYLWRELEKRFLIGEGRIPVNRRGK